MTDTELNVIAAAAIMGLTILNESEGGQRFHPCLIFFISGRDGPQAPSVEDAKSLSINHLLPLATGRCANHIPP
ncbi:MAG: hypothetical protein CMJ19_06165 [Phycisphaeraceae bacterium]|nr:hypothetical protein [Phycisphaeraceae bacterium]